MPTRLVLGCGSLGQALVDRLATRPEPLLVVSEDEGRTKTLREENIRAVHGDPADMAVVEAALEGEAVMTVLVAGNDPERNRRVATVARERFPDAVLVAATGQEPSPEVRATLRSVADEVIDTGVTVMDRLRPSMGAGGGRVRTLQRILRTLDGPLAVVMHDNPDPDAIASAVGLVAIADAAGTDAVPIYGGEVAHQENRALVNLLEYDLEQIDDVSLEAFDAVALVDHSRPGVNDSLPPETPVDIVVDHHPPREPVDARFVYLRSDVGATSTLVVDLLRRLDRQPSAALATGLLYGIQVDTKDFAREVTVDDFEAAAYLVPWVDHSILTQVEEPSVSVDTLETIARAVSNREVRNGVLASSVGPLRDRDALAQAADQLLDLEDVTTTLVYGLRNDTIYVSARARGTDLDVGETLRDAFDQIGDAGGHADMAGAQIPVGSLLDDLPEDDREAREAALRQFITERFYETLRERPHWGTPRPFDEPGIRFPRENPGDR